MSCKIVRSINCLLCEHPGLIELHTSMDLSRVENYVQLLVSDDVNVMDRVLWSQTTIYHATMSYIHRTSISYTHYTQYRSLGRKGGLRQCPPTLYRNTLTETTCI